MDQKSMDRALTISSLAIHLITSHSSNKNAVKINDNG